MRPFLEWWECKHFQRLLVTSRDQGSNWRMYASLSNCTICPCISGGRNQKQSETPLPYIIEDVVGDGKTPPRDAIITTNILITCYCCLLRRGSPHPRIQCSQKTLPIIPSGLVNPKAALLHQDTGSKTWIAIAQWPLLRHASAVQLLSTTLREPTQPRNCLEPFFC